MNMKLYIVLAIILNVSLTYGWGKVKTVDELDLNKYTGRWYEVYNSLIQRWTFQRNFYCTTADYALKNGVIQVLNSGRVGSSTGSYSEARGTAKVVDPKEPGALNVQFEKTPKFLRSSSANYLVVKLGPVENGEYQYTVITSPFKSFLWVLARDVKKFNANFNKEILDYLRNNGYKYFWNRPRKSYQGSDCVYKRE